MSCLVSCVSQETQACLAIPSLSAGGGHKLEVHCSTQSIGILQTMLATVLGVKAPAVTVVNRHVGGAYGGKVFLHAPNAVATCVCALKVGGPVLCQLDRNADMSSLGGRPAASADFEVEYDPNANGKMHSLHITVLS